MNELIRKAGVLIEALPYIQRFRRAVVVVKFGGSAMEDAGTMRGVLADVTFMECVGMRPVVVHGGGKAISKRLRQDGIETAFVKGLRVTCAKTMGVVESVLNGRINPEIVRTLERLGGRAAGVRGQQVFRVTRRRERVGDEEVDLGFVGEPQAVDTGPLEALLSQDVIPVVTPLGLGPGGETYNVNADSAAAALARGLKARKLVYLSDVPGLLADAGDARSVISTLRVGDVERLESQGVIEGGMLPKVRSGVEALRAGVGKIHMVDGRMPHALLLEVFTDKGVGTEIVWDEQESRDC